MSALRHRASQPTRSSRNIPDRHHHVEGCRQGELPGSLIDSQDVVGRCGAGGETNQTFDAGCLVGKIAELILLDSEFPQLMRNADRVSQSLDFVDRCFGRLVRRHPEGIDTKRYRDLGEFSSASREDVPHHIRKEQTIPCPV